MAIMPQSSNSKTTVFLSISSQRVDVPLAWLSSASCPSLWDDCDAHQARLGNRVRSGHPIGPGLCGGPTRQLVSNRNSGLDPLRDRLSA